MNNNKNRLALEGGSPTIDNKLPSIKDKSGRQIDTKELEEVKSVLESGTLSYLYGNKVKKFEKLFAAKFGIKYAFAVSSGTAALHTAMVYLNPEPGDEIIMSPISDMGSVIPILYQLAVPVFVDIDPKTQNIDPELIESKITKRTKGIIVTHIYGNAADMNPIMKIAKKYNIFVIEDCAQAHLTMYHGRYVGTIGDMGCFSLQQSKHITTGDGGMVISHQNKQFQRDIRLCTDKGWPREKKVRDHYFLAPAYHMTELQGAVGIAQIEKYDNCINNRRKTAKMLDELIDKNESVQLICELPDTIGTYFLYCFRLNPAYFKVNIQKIVEALNKEGLPCEQGYPGNIPLYLYPVIKDKKTFGTSGWPFDMPHNENNYSYSEGLCPEAEKACEETIVLPWTEGYEDKHVYLIADAINKVIRAYEK